MGFFLGGEEQTDHKQHLNLSNYAWTTIEGDILNFQNEPIQMNLSGFLNRILSNYLLASSVSISNHFHKLSEEYWFVLADKEYDVINHHTKKKLVTKIIDKEINHLVENLKAFPKGVGKKFIINKRNKDILENVEDDKYFGGNLGLYLKCLFEEYTRLPHARRERYYFLDNISVIEEAIKTKRQLKIRLLNQQVIYFNPLRIEVDTMGLYNYLVGYANANSEIPYQATFRVSRIDNIKILLSQSGKIAESLIEKLERALEEKGPQFIGSNTTSIQIKLTERGLKKYRNNIFLRPQITKQEKDVYHFSCSESQALFYFFKFSDDCEIIHPERLRNLFRLNYQAGLKTYLSSNQSLLTSIAKPNRKKKIQKT
jgi:hypothetical protein